MRLFTSARERRLWLLALAAVVAIYATLGRVPVVAAALTDRDAVDDVFFWTFVAVVVAIAVAGFSVRPGRREVAVGVAVAGAYASAFLRLGTPAERTHLFEFGVIAVLIHLALLERRANGATIRAPAAMAMGVGAALGWIDEGIQALLPNRVFDPVDLAFNTGAAVPAVLAVVSPALGSLAAGDGRERGR